MFQVLLLLSWVHTSFSGENSAEIQYVVPGTYPPQQDQSLWHLLKPEQKEEPLQPQIVKPVADQEPDWFGASRDNPLDGMNVFQLKPTNVLDPATFNKTIKLCHAKIGEEFYLCSMTCEEKYGTEVVLNLETDTSEESKPVKYKSNWANRMRKILTFGLLGNDRSDDVESVDGSDMEIQNGGRVLNEPDAEEKCLETCRTYFRDSYRKCICNIHSQAKPCMQELEESVKSEYKFDWDKFD